MTPTMQLSSLKTITLATLLSIVRSDMYLHNPRGSNNRLNEASANRDNANRLFDSQNNNRGGYNVGDLDPVDGFQDNDYLATFDDMYNWDFLYQEDARRQQYEMLYFAESDMSVTWTNQHGTGNEKTNTHIILQFACDNWPRATTAQGQSDVLPNEAVDSAAFTGTGFRTTADKAAEIRKHGLRTELYNGGNTNQATDAGNLDTSTLNSRYQSNNNARNGRRESEDFYEYCNSRSRNYGLFHADQDLQGDTQIYTRQNAAGTRRGLECPEERDYYPWWNPSPFHDIAILTPDVTYCEESIAPESQNVMPKCHCIRPDVTTATTDWSPEESYIVHNLNETACTQADGSWECFSWDASEPECVESYWSKVNHLGNVDTGNSKRGGKMANYDWTLPSFEELTSNHYCFSYTEQLSTSGDTTLDNSFTDPSEYNCVRMMLRIRYNMSTMDYDPYLTDSTMDEDDHEGILSPIENNPTVDVGVFAQGLQLAINTAQTGRTFQDNSHTFLVCENPSSAAWDGRTMININVRGKRGNIVQTFPAIEYDFEPQHVEIEPNQCMHFQWTGSNTHNNGAPGGDGQTGDAGEGRGGSDRSNIVQTKSMDESFPIAYDKADDADIDNFFDYVTCYHPLYPGATVSSEDAQLILGSGGFYKGLDYATEQISDDSRFTGGETPIIDELLNNVSGAFRQGLICCVNNNAVSGSTEKEFSFISTRNNNFSNRSQKLKIIVTRDADDSANW